MNTFIMVLGCVAPLICAALCQYVRRLGVGGPYLTIWAWAFVDIACTVALRTLNVTTPANQGLLDFYYFGGVASISSTVMIFIFGVRNLYHGHDTPLLQAVGLSVAFGITLTVIDYVLFPYVRFTALWVTVLAWAAIAAFFLFNARSLFYTLTGVVTIFRALNVLVFILVQADSNAQGYPVANAAIVIFNNFSMCLCLLLLAFDDARRTLKQSQEARAEAEEKTRKLNRENAEIATILDIAKERIVVEDAAGYIRYVNQVVADVWGGGSKVNIVGRHFNDAFPTLASMRDKIRDDVAMTLAENQVWNAQLQFSRPDGAVVYGDVRVTQLPDGRILFSDLDITKSYLQQQREQKLKVQLSEAQKLESIGQLAGTIAHDFNNIIAAVRTFAELVTDQTPPAQASAYAQRIVASCKRASELVRQILSYSRATKAPQDAVQIDDVVNEAAGYLKANLPGSISLDVDFASANTVVRGNAAQLVQIFLNLLVNARDAIGDAGGNIQINLASLVVPSQKLDFFAPGFSGVAQSGADQHYRYQFVVGVALPDQPYVVVGIRDSGCGISKATMMQMFEPYFTTKEKSGGTGFGLAVAAAVISAHAGFIVVESDEGAGTLFRVFVPAARI